MRLLRYFAISLLLIAAPVLLTADTHWLTLNGPGKVPNEILNNAYISPYAATLDSNNINVYCVDPLNESFFGRSWGVNETSLAVGSSLANTRMGEDGRVKYEQAAYLLFFTDYMHLSTADRQAIQGEVWDLIAPSIYGKHDDKWYGEALAHYDDERDYGNVRILTDPNAVRNGVGVPIGGYQEFVYMTPEPASLLLLGTGLIGLGSIVRRKLGV